MCRAYYDSQRKPVNIVIALEIRTYYFLAYDGSHHTESVDFSVKWAWHDVSGFYLEGGQN